MSGLLEVANVERGVDAVRMRQFDKAGCSMTSWVTDICAPDRDAAGALLTGDAASTDVGEALDELVFAAIVQKRGRNMCSDGNEEADVRDAMEAEAEKAAGRALWSGFGAAPEDDPVYLSHADIPQVAAGADAEATLANLLEEFWSRATGIRTDQTILHLGSERLFRMAQKVVVANEVVGLNIKVATSPGYHRNAMALTGPIRIRMSSDQILRSHDASNNTLIVEGDRLLAMSFDPCYAVRAALPA